MWGTEEIFLDGCATEIGVSLPRILNFLLVNPMAPAAIPRRMDES